MSSEYIPGRINIGQKEISNRRIVQGYGGLFLSLALASIIYFFGFSFIVYLFLIIPIYISFIGFYQAKEKFCISYGRTGVCNVSGQVGETRDVIGRLNRNKDAQKSIKMMAVAAAGSLIVTLLIAMAFS